jgi:uncharacterized phiE125 gp8 family phage protein
MYYGNLGVYGDFVAYRSLNLTESSPAQSFTEPLSVDEMRFALKLPDRIDSPQDVEIDDQLTGLISAAREQAEILQNRDLVRKQWDMSLDYWTSYQIELRSPLVSVELVRYRDSTGAYTTLVENTDYIVDTAKSPGIMAPVYGGTWPTYTPWPSSSLLIRFTSGVASDSVFWSDAGARVKRGMRALISDWYFNVLPFVKGSAAAQDYPYGVTSNLSYGAVPRVK